MADIKFRVDGHLFRVRGKTLQYYVPDYTAGQLGEISGFWDSIASFGSSVADSVSEGFKNFSLADITNKLPSMETIGKAVQVAGGIVGVKATLVQQKLIEQQSKNQSKADKKARKQTQGNQTLIDSGLFPPGTTPSFDTGTMMLLGGGALVLFLAMKK